MNFIGELAALGQAIGLVLSKRGMLGDFSPFRANVIRMLAAVILFWIWTAFEGKTSRTFNVLCENPQSTRDSFARSRCVDQASPGHILVAARDPTCRNWCGKYFDGMDKKLYTFQ